MAAKIKRGADIPDKHHVMRYCDPKHFDGEKLSDAAFLLRNSEQCLSFDWLEFFNDTKSASQRLKSVQQAVGKRLKIKTDGKFARISVGSVKRRNQNLSVKYAPSKKSKSHAEICPYAGTERTPMDRLEFAQVLANEVTKADIFPAK